MNVETDRTSPGGAMGLAVAALRQYLQQTAPIRDDELTEFLQRCVSLGEYRKGTFFTSAGDTHDKVGFVVSGLFRVYYIGVGNRYYVRNFCTEGAPIGAYASILTRQPANAFVEALEDSRVLEFPFSEMAKQFDVSSAWERLGRRLAEGHYISRERREQTLLMLTAAERLERFVEDFPTLQNRVSGADVASYIGVRPETLSRLRRKRLGR